MHLIAPSVSRSAGLKRGEVTAHRRGSPRLLAGGVAVKRHWASPSAPHKSPGQYLVAEFWTPHGSGPHPATRTVDLAERRIRQKQVLGGLTHEYYIAGLPPHAATERSRSCCSIAFSRPTGLPSARRCCS